MTTRNTPEKNLEYMELEDVHQSMMAKLAGALGGGIEASLTSKLGRENGEPSVVNGIKMVGKVIVQESENSFDLILDLPGVKVKDLQVKHHSDGS